MDGLVFHGCAIPLPFPKHPGLKKQGPKPSQLFSLCNSSNLPRWMLRIGGAEAVADFCLERIDLAQTITALTQRLVKLEQRQEALELQLRQQLQTVHDVPDEELATLDGIEQLLQETRQLLQATEAPVVSESSDEHHHHVHDHQGQEMAA